MLTLRKMVFSEKPIMVGVADIDMNSGGLLQEESGRLA
jgi:hypothetical protein